MATILADFAPRRVSVRRAYLNVEELGARIALAVTHNWTGLGLTNLASDAANWSDRTVPLAPDAIVFDGLAGAPSNKPATIDLPTLADVELQPNYTGTVSFNNDFTAGTHFGMGGGTVSIASGKVLTTGGFDLSKGTLKDGGQLALTLQPGAQQALGTFSAGTGQRVIFSGGTGMLIDVGAQLTISGDVRSTGAASWINRGTVNWTGGLISLIGPGVFSNYGTFNVRCDGLFDSAGAFANPGTFNNLGIVTKSVGAAGAEAEFELTFNDVVPPGGATPQVNVGAGHLLIDFGNGGDHKATFSVAANTVLEFGVLVGGNHTFHTGTTFTGTGGTVQFTGTSVQIGFGESVASAGPVTVQLAAGGLTGGGSFTSGGTLSWSAGTIDNISVEATGSVKFTGNADKTLANTTLTLRGGATWDGTGNILMNSATISNFSTFEVQNDQVIRELNQAVPSQFLNQQPQGGPKGVLTKTAGVGVTEIDVKFISSGDVLLNGRTLSLQGPTIEQNGGTTDLGGGTLQIKGTYSLFGGALSGPGTLQGSLDNTGTGRVDVGASIGTLTITGNYRQGVAATLRVKYDKTGNRSDLIQINGTATLAGILDLLLLSGDPAQNVVFTVLTATGGTNGQFGTTPAGYTPGYPGTMVTLKKN